MAHDAFRDVQSRDPRRQASARNDPRSPNQAPEDNRKRGASRSPVGSDKPSAKRTASGLDVRREYFVPGAHSRQGSTFNAQQSTGSSPSASRRNSLQTGGAGSSSSNRGPLELKTQTNATNGVISRSGLDSGHTTPLYLSTSVHDNATGLSTAPMASMANGMVLANGNLSTNQSRVLDALLRYGQQSAVLARAEIFQSQKEDKMMKAEREFKSMQPHFASFSALREQHTNAKSRTADEFRKIQSEYNKKQAAQKETAQTLAALLSSPEVQPDNNQVSRAEFEDFKNARHEWEKGIDEKLASLEKRIKDVPAKTSTVAARDSDVLHRIQDLETKLVGLESSPAKNDSTSMGDGSLDRLKSVEASVNELLTDTMLEDHEQMLKEHKQALEEHGQILEKHKQRIESQDQKNTSLEQDIQSNAKNIGSLETSMTARKTNEQSMSRDIGECQQRIKDVQANVQKLPQAHSLTTINKTLADLREDMATKIDGLNQRLTEAGSELERFASAADLAAVQSSLSSLQSSMKDVQTSPPSAPRSARATPTVNGPSPGFAQFQPLMPHQGNEEELPKIDRMDSQLLALESSVMQLKQQIDNTLTDPIVQQMVDQFSTMYPEAKAFQTAITQFHREIKDLWNKLGNLEGGCNTLFSRQGDQDKAVDKLRQDLTALQSTVESHDDVVNDGRQQLKDLTELVRTANGEISALHGGQERIDKILKEMGE